MNKILKIKRCLISVSNKKNIVSFSKELIKLGVDIISTGNTFKTLKDRKIKVNKVENITKFPEILDGRVKTLHPNIFGGILADTNKEKHTSQMIKHRIKKVDLVVVNLYPFEQVIKKNSSLENSIENIDIGGPSMVRAAAKNFISTVAVIDVEDYDRVILELKDKGGVSLELRKYLAVKAFEKILEYDYHIFKWFNENFSKEINKKFMLLGNIKQKLRYGENPHQKAEVYINSELQKETFYKKMSGKELSYNNLNDMKAAFNLIVEFKKPTSVIIKHSIPCGVSESNNIITAWDQSFKADSLSAFGGVIAFNRIVDEKLAKKISKVFLEVIAAVGFTENAFKILSKKPNLRIIEVNLIRFLNNDSRNISVFPDSFMVQDFDKMRVTKNNLDTVSKKVPSDKQLEELLFAYKVVKHVKSNAIVISKNKTTIGIGSGNTSRIDSVNFAILKSSRGNNKKLIPDTKNLKGCVLASDAFFPFTDSIDLIKGVGIKSIIQPGGSINDKKVINAVDKANMSMIFTKKRCFSH